MKELVIYECGKMSGLTYEEMNDWRVEFSGYIRYLANFDESKIKVINPVRYYNFESKKYKNDFEVMQFDLNKVRQSDLLVVNLDGLNTSVASCIEIYEAYKNNIPVLAFGDNKIYDKLHPWIKCCITRHDITMDEMIEYIRDFYMN